MSFFLFFEPNIEFFSPSSFLRVLSPHDQGPLDMLYSSVLFKLECLSPEELGKNMVAQVPAMLLKLGPPCSCSAGDSDKKSEN